MNNIYSTDFIILVINIIEKKINRKINDDEENNILKLIKNIPTSYLTGITNKQLTKLIIDTVIEDMNLKNCEKNNIDIHEMLKEHISDIKSNSIIKKEENGSISSVSVESLFGVYNFPELIQSLKEPSTRVHEVYLLLDSKYRIIPTDNGYYQWGCIDNYTSRQGTLNYNGPVTDIVSMQICTFMLPDGMDDEVFKYNRISVLIKEFESQAFIAHEERRFHFMAEPRVLKNNRIEADTRNFHKGEYRFNEAITSLDTITLSFGNPIEPLIFDKDRLNGLITCDRNLLVIQFDEEHKIKSGSYIMSNLINNKKNVQCLIRDSKSIYIYYPTKKYNITDEDLSFIEHSNSEKNKLMFKDDNLCNKDNNQQFLFKNCQDIIFFESKRIFITLELRFLYKKTK